MPASSPSKVPRVLLTNDDGIDAPGLAVLEAVAAELAEEVWVVAPEHDQSGTSHSISLHTPLRVSRRGERRFGVLGTPGDHLQVRCYVDEILIHQLPDPKSLKAHMQVRGTSVEADLAFDRVQPYVTPKIQLSDQRTERVDVRVLPVIFRVVPRKDVRLFPGQIVDVYIAGK